MSNRMTPGAQKIGTKKAMAIEVIIKMPTPKSRPRLFWIISPSQVLHFIRMIAHGWGASFFNSVGSLGNLVNPKRQVASAKSGLPNF